MENHSVLNGPSHTDIGQEGISMGASVLPNSGARKKEPKPEVAMRDEIRDVKAEIKDIKTSVTGINDKLTFMEKALTVLLEQAGLSTRDIGNGSHSNSFSSVTSETDRRMDSIPLTTNSESAPSGVQGRSLHAVDSSSPMSRTWSPSAQSSMPAPLEAVQKSDELSELKGQGSRSRSDSEQKVLTGRESPSLTPMTTVHVLGSEACHSQPQSDSAEQQSEKGTLLSGVDFSRYKCLQTSPDVDNRIKYFNSNLDDVVKGEIIPAQKTSHWSERSMTPVDLPMNFKHREMSTIKEQPRVQNGIMGSEGEVTLLKTEVMNSGRPQNRAEEEVIPNLQQQSPDTGSVRQQVSGYPSQMPEKDTYQNSVLASVEDSSDDSVLVSEEYLQKLTISEAKRAAECTDPKSQGMDTIICVDCSDSMKGEGLKQTKDIIGNFLDGLEEIAVEHGYEENVALVTFGNQNEVAQHLTNDYGKVRDVLEDLEADGPSPMMTGLVMCLSALNVRGGVINLGDYKIPPRIMIFTDGQPTDERILRGADTISLNGATLPEIKKKILRFVPKLAANDADMTCVSVGDTDKSLLEDIAKVTRGKVICPAEVPRLCRRFWFHSVISKLPSKITSQGRQLDKEELVAATRKIEEELDDDDIEDIFAIISCSEKEALTVPSPGSRVRRGPDWASGEEDGRGVGTVVACKRNGTVNVQWDNDTRGRYSYGPNNGCEVIVVDEPRVLKEGETLAVGVHVKRGKDWKWEDQDGGPDSVGTVFKVDENNVVHVLWQNGKKGNYRFGFDQKYDIEVCLGERASDGRHSPATQGSSLFPVWEWQDADDKWHLYPVSISNSIETNYHKKPGATVVVHNNDKMYRVLLSSMQQREIASGKTCDIRRRELDEDRNLQVN